MLRFAATMLLVLVLGLSDSAPNIARAQKPSSQDTPSAGITPDQARQALDVLNDPAKRAAFAATLNAITKAQPAPVSAPAQGQTQPHATPPGQPAPGGSAQGGSAQGASAPVANAPAAASPEGLPIPLAPDSLGAQVIVSASAFVNRLGNEAMDALDTVQSLPLLYGWTVVMLTNPVARDLLLDVAWRVALVLIVAVLVEHGLRWLVRRPIRRLEGVAPLAKPASLPPLDPAHEEGEARAEAGETEPPHPNRHRPTAWMLLRRLPVVLARLVLELVPVMGIAVAGHLIAGSSVGGQGGQSVSRLIIIAIVDAYAISAALLCVARMLLSPRVHRLRLVHMPDETAAYMMRWIRRLVLIAVIGYAVGEAWLLLGLSAVAHDSLQKAVGLILHICLAIIVLQKRVAVRDWIRAPDEATGPMARFRNRLASAWHWIALFFIVAIWLVYAIELPHGFTLILHYFVVTAALLIGARLTLLTLIGALDRLTRPSNQTLSLDPALQARLRMYFPVVSLAVRVTIYLLAGLGLLQLYGLDTLVWLATTSLGQRIVSFSGSLLATVIMAFAVWETVNIGVQRHLDRLQREAQVAKSARLRTLLPLLRTTLLITIAVVAGLMVLSEIGINIAPLLAGAGILGVAIGFGSQKLVQDLITGIFLLLENAMQVGDSVTVSGLSGTVEALSVRTIRLRAADGSVHIIPFSAVTSVTNVNRGLGNASVSVTVAFDEDTDRVSEELKAIVAGMRSDPALSASMLSDLQLWGVDKVDGASVTIAGQVVCTDSGRWTVQREFNRRMKRRFQELGIRVFNPLQTIAVPGGLSNALVPTENRDGHEHAQAAD